MIIIGHFQFHQKQITLYTWTEVVGSCFINNYNLVLLKAWEATLEVHSVQNYYKALTYMTVYVLKTEIQVLESLKQWNAVYNISPELWLQKYLPGISFINTNLPQNRISIIKSKEERKDLLHDSTDVFKCNIIDRYIDRLVCGKFALVLRNLHHIITKSIFEHDYRTDLLKKKLAMKIFIFP